MVDSPNVARSLGWNFRFFLVWLTKGTFIPFVLWQMEVEGQPLSATFCAVGVINDGSQPYPSVFGFSGGSILPTN